MLARNHEASTWALTCATWAIAGVPAPGAVLLACVGSLFGDWPDIDMPRARITKLLCLLPYPVAKVNERGAQRRHEKGRRKGKRMWDWRPFPGYQIHQLFFWLSGVVFDLCATAADRADTVPGWGPKFRTHRGLTHSAWFALGTGVAVWFGLWFLGDLSPTTTAHFVPIFGTEDLRGLLAETAVIGTFGHVLGDCCTDYACAPFAPVWRWDGRRYVEMGLWEPMRFKVSKWVEDAIVTPLCGVACVAAILGAFGGLSAVLHGLGRFWAALA